MTKALVVVFFRYTPRADDHYKTQGELFLKYAKRWLPQIDTVYLANGGWEFAKGSWPENTVVYSSDYQSHWHYMNELFKMVKEDTFLLIDPDILIYDPKVIEDGFAALETHGAAGILDNSGSLDLFPANEYRDIRRRYTPYMTFGHTTDFKNRDFTPTQKDGKFEFDSMGKITYDLYEKLSYKEFRDDRSTLYLNEDGSMTRSINLDSPSFEWSKDRKDLGYYHIRNSSIGLSLMAEYKVDKDAYNRRKSITPFREMMRLLAWQWICDEESGDIISWIQDYKNVLDDYGVSLDTWRKYIDEFRSYHGWLNE